ncbi:nucleotidyltransferase substrate binding protein [Rodentibacter pneumotropicus]|uniref:Nucleotidyltransferase n=1 Tax=Rodentibacter pneumotropicus TaxID=758 RepID=A0A4S2QKR9_9PAST|nr:nucleotidyltransferase substrate binding protein [Rodentibacter pneumotropicus]OOF61100.1 nucleotidyltransferase [Rodentibacter pneumotropicus]THA06536.1 nucleotidyltransferase [Rodentibacter pneumotropicus]THA17144.1 nucleotidyltransferase [Rodentibacter pneumotropicus]
MLDFTPLEKAIFRLEEGLNRYQQDISDIQIRDGLIQRFEFTYELSHKMLKRYLIAVSPNPELYDGISFQDLIRTGNEYGLLQGEWLDWKQYREMRSRTSHTYDEDTAILVVQGIPKFLSEVKHLQEKLKSGQNGQSF